MKPHPDAFVVSYDFERGYIEWCVLEPTPDGKIVSTIYGQQFLPHRFFDRNRDLGDMQGRPANTQDHWRHAYRIPHAIHNRWLEELGNPNLDPDVQKDWDRRLNSREYHKFRVTDGRL